MPAEASPESLDCPKLLVSVSVILQEQMDEIQAQQNSIPELQKLVLESGSETTNDQSSILMQKRWNWWVVVALNVAFLLIGQFAGVLLGKFYFTGGGSSTWMEALLQTAGFPVLFLFFPLRFFPFAQKLPTNSSSGTSRPSSFTFTWIYCSLGVLLAVDNMLYSIGLIYLPVSIYSLICATQLAFNAIFSFFINSERLTILTLNSVILLTLSASLVAINGDSEEEAASEGKYGYVIGFLSTVCASAAYSLLLSLMQLTFQKVLKKETFSVVLEMQIYTSLVATCVCLSGLFASGQGKGLKAEMEGFEYGRVAYIVCLVGTALAWQIFFVGAVGLTFLVSSLFSNAVSMLSLPFVPVVSVLFYGEKMDGGKVIAMLLTIWGFASYLYQNCLYENDSKLEGHE
ncbi:hypothetical protein SLEP1_g42818 [Rubroshorea leprosula]|uniref:Probable purine permease n=1 Tax=Rubroshorea leprosula TaxID=152421 RepID=A0AAV5LB33_9ROSI|nr:hypothetical protein SLEP1_g42818 [Rubroshorea leprosula]